MSNPRRKSAWTQSRSFPDKPKGMHWRTYRRLEERYEDLQARWTVVAMRRFGFRRPGYGID